MIRLYDVINLLNKEEIRNLKLFLNRTNSHIERKDIALFDYVRKHKQDVDDTVLMSQLYPGKSDKNSFYRLKNRLMNDINKSLMVLNYDKNEYNIVINLINLARVFSSREEYKVAYEYLIQAEQRAVKKEFFDLLDLIYSALIKLSHESIEYNPINFIEKRKKNHKSLHVLQEIDDLLGALVYRIRVSHNYSTEDYRFSDLLQKTVNEFMDNDEVKKSATLQFKIYHSLSKLLLQKKDYISLEAYLRFTYDDFVNRGLFNKSNHESKLAMLNSLVNSLFKNNKYDESLEKANVLYEAMSEYDNLLFDKYVLYYYNSLIINYQSTDKRKAISVLMEAKDKLPEQQLKFYSAYIYGNLAVFYFDLKDFKNARKNLAILKRSESFKNMDNVFVFKMNIVELLTFFEFGDIDLFDYQLNLIKKDFKELLENKNYKREKIFIDLVSKMDKLGETELKNQITAFVQLAPQEETSESDIINYNEWLKSKLK